MLDQSHERLLWSRACAEEIWLKENLTFQSKHLTWSISQRLHLETVQNIQYTEDVFFFVLKIFSLVSGVPTTLL